MSITFFSLHPAQQEIYTDQLLNTSSPLYNIGGYIVLKGNLDRNKFHEVIKSAPEVLDFFKLRFNFREPDFLVYYDENYKDCQYSELDFSSEDNPEARAVNWAQERLNTPFVLDKESLPFEQCLLKISETEHWFFGKYHHLITDGYGFIVWIQYIAGKYNSLMSGEDRNFSFPLYRDEAIKARQYLNSPEYEADAVYWKEKIKARPDEVLQKRYVSGGITSIYRLKLSDGKRELFEQLQLNTKSSLQQLTLASLLIYLGKTSPQSEFIFGVPIHKRGSRVLRNIVGMFSGILPFKGNYNEENTLLELLAEISATQRSDYRHQNYPVGDLSRHLKVNNSEGYLYQIIVNYEPLHFELDFGEKLDASIVRLANEDERNPLQLAWRDYGSHQPLELQIHYGEDYFSEREIELLAERLVYIIEQFSTALNHKIGSLDILPGAEMAQLSTFNTSDVSSYTPEYSILDLFHSQVVMRPDSIALVSGPDVLSYRDLDNRSNQLGRYLLSKGMGKETLVPLCMDRGIDMLVAILGILKAGGAYVPLDPSYPDERISFMLQDTGASIALSSMAYRSRLESGDNLLIIEPDGKDAEAIGTASAESLGKTAAPQDLAYVIYTSGSTGLPKGVLVEHRNVVSLVKDVSYVNFSEKDGLLVTGSPSFDATTFEYWGMLLNGGRLILCSEEDLLDSVELKKLIRHNQVTTMWFTSSWFNQLMETDSTLFEGLKTILVGGEQLSESHIARFRELYRSTRIINGYGPTENTTFSLTYEIEEVNGPIPIGRPLNNRQAYVLGSNHSLLPVGVAGEICLGGAGLSRGYLNRPELTAEKFIDHPFNKEGVRLYKTGDLGRWLPDGNLEYLGRLDEQVKIRGYRIEPGEIENVLLQSGLVRQALIAAQPDGRSGKRLVGYVVVAEQPFGKEMAESYLLARLPEYMVPTLWVEMPQIPLTANGKTNKAALPQPDLSLNTSNSYTEPQTELQNTLVKIWQDLLGLQKIGIHDNFFELGGDSILAIQLVSRIRRLGYELQPKDIFIQQNVARLSSLLETQVISSIATEQGLLTGSCGLLPIQQWYLQNASGNISHFNQSVLLTIDKLVTAQLLQDVADHLISHHDALRFCYTKTEDGWQQTYGTAKAEVLSENLKIITAGSLSEEVGKKADEYQRSLDIKEGRLIRTVLMHTPEYETQNRLLIVVHHLAIDGVSWRILLEDLEELLNDHFVAGTNQPQTVKGTSYRQWYEVLKQYSLSRKLLAQRDYWQDVVKNYQPLPTDKTSDEIMLLKHENHHTVKLSSDYTQRLLRDVPRVYKTEINDILLAALAHILNGWTGRKSVTIGLEGHGRESIVENIDTSRTIGWFTSLFPLRLETNGASEPGHLIRIIKDQLRQLPDKGLGFGVLKFLNKESFLQEAEPWDITYNYLGQLDNVLERSNLLGIAQEDSGPPIAEDQSKNAKLSVECHIINRELVIKWNFSTLHYHDETIEKLTNAYKEKLLQLIDHCTNHNGNFDLNASDCGLSPEISNQELNNFLNIPFKDKRRGDEIETMFRLSSLQEGMLFHGLYSKGSGAYISQFTCDLNFVNTDYFRLSWEGVLQAHNVFRSAFYHDSFTIPVQCVYRHTDLEIANLDYRDLTEPQQAAAIQQYLKEDSARGFNFIQPPLTRFALIQLSEEKYKMIWTTHHIIFDGWSLPVLFKEFLDNYDLLTANKKVPQKNVDDYSDYIRYLQNADKIYQETFWRGYLKGIQQSTLLPFIKNQADRTKGVGSYQNVSIQPEARAIQRIKEYAQNKHLTVNTIMQGVWAYLLSVYARTEHVLYAVTVSGRPDDLPDVEQRVGMYINTLPLHAHIQEDIQIVEWLRGIQAGQISSRQHQHTPINEIQKWSGIQGDFFDSLLVFLNYPVKRLVSEKEWALQIDNVYMYEQNNFPLTITIGGIGELSVVFTYNKDLLKEEYIKEIRNHFESVLFQIVDKPSGILGDMKLLSRSEKQEVRNLFKMEGSADKQQKSIVDLFKEEVEKAPENPAIVFEEVLISYRELDERSDRLACYLQNKGVGEESLVPLCLERGPDLVIAILGVLKAGGAFVPIDPDYPQERIAYILADTKSTLIVSNSASKKGLSNIGDIKIIELDGEDEKTINSLPKSNLTAYINAEQLAYVIYTSGSTGQPKGVMIEHKSLLNYVVNKKTRYITETEGNAGSFVHLSYTFDASLTAIFMPLLSGKLMVIGSKQVANVFEDPNLWKYAPYDFIKLTPIHLGLLKDAVPDTNKKRLSSKFVVGGEALLLSHFDQFIEKGLDTEVVNEYGPTEATVGCSTYRFNISGNNEKIKDSVPIGKPIDNTNLYILGARQELLPTGIAGELYISGVQVARGYLNRPEMTAEKFVNDTFAAETGTIMYRTGDLARWLPDGNIEYLGRIDDQVKIRGYRIELGEIEVVLQQHESVKQAVVIAREDAGGNKQLNAFIVPEAEFNKEVLQAYLQSRLPEYMVPALWSELESLPVTLNGKVDRKALADLDLNVGATEEYTPPGNETERKLAEIWQELLEIEQVGIHSDFFDLGGHSLLAIRLISFVRRELGVELSINEIFDYPTISLLSGKINTIDNAGLLPSISVMPRPSQMPLSFSQERLWFIDQLEGSLQYHITAVIRLQGNLNIAALEYSLGEIVNRHEILRSVYYEEEGIAYQKIKPAGRWRLNVAELTDEQKVEKELRKHIALKAQVPFDLSADDMLRAELVVLSQTEHMLLITMHHIASDAWSMPIMVREVAELYAAYTENRQALLDVVPLQYADYAIWQKEYLSEALLETKLAYWKTKLEGVSPLQLPTDYARPSEISTRGASAEFVIPADLSKSLAELSKVQGATLYMTLLSAFNVLLYRYSAQEDICVGTSIAGRPQAELEGLIGFFVNTLALRSKLRAEMAFTDLLAEVRATMLEAYANQEVPFERVVEAVVKDRDPGRSPLFQVMLVLRNTPEVPQLRLGDLILTGQPYEHTTVKFDLTFFLTETANGLEGSVLYSTDLFNARRIERMIRHFTSILNSIVSSPKERIGKVRMLSDIEEAELISGLNVSRVKKRREKSLIDFFEEHAQKHPESTALQFEGKLLKYSELDSRSNQLAHYLKSRGVRADTIVPLFIERGLEMIIGILGILKAGGAYLPIDPEFPEDRVQYMLKDSGANIVLGGISTLRKLSKTGDLEYIELDGDWSLFSGMSSKSPDEYISPEQLLYVIYTSGSTGQPKGVLIEHKNMLDYVQGLDEHIGINSCKSYALVSTIATDLGNTVLFSWLVSGGSLHVFSKEMVSHIENMHSYFENHRIDCLKIVPSHWKALLMDGTPLLPVRLLVFGGEALQGDVVRLIGRFDNNCRVVNHYGPTETTVGKLLHEVDPGEEYGTTVPVGKPFSDTKIYVLSKEGALCPEGVHGELHIGGAGIARGYLNNEELTSLKFVRDPFDSTGRSKIYKTGDLVSYDMDGNIQFLGRVDDQVKIRGYRVEPGEIGRVLEGSDLVSQSVVVANDDNQGNKQLVAYIVPGGSFNREEILDYAKEHLPEYMVPAHFVELAEMPLTANGKVDRKALPQVDSGASNNGEYVAPRTAVEERLAEIWQDILEVEQVGIHDDFFELGGHSLLAVRLISAVRKAFKTELPISDVFDYPSVAALAAQLDKPAEKLKSDGIQPVQPRPQFIPLSFSQERLWFIDRMEGSVQYHVPAVLRLKGTLNIKALNNALRDIVNRHEVLRTSILEKDGQAYQVIKEPNRWTLMQIDGSVYKENAAGLEECIRQIIREPFDLSKDDMIRGHLITLSEEEVVLVVTSHHIASDGWSRSILVRELVSLYKAYDQGLSKDLEPLSLQYADYAIWQRTFLQGGLLDEKLDYWKKKLDGVAVLNLPADHVRPATQSTKGAITGFRIEQPLAKEIMSLSKSHGTTLYMTLLAAFKVLLHRYSGQEDICVGSGIAGRQQQELEGLIGFFVNTLAMRSEVRGDMPFTEFLQSVKLTAMEAYSHQEVPFEKVVDAVVKERDVSRNPLFQVTFVVQNTPDVPDLLLGDVALSVENYDHVTTKFDITFSITETDNGLEGLAEYNTDLYEKRTIDRMTSHFVNLLRSIVELPHEKLSVLGILSEDEKASLLDLSAAVDIFYNPGDNLVTLFEEQAAKTPEAIALIFEEEKLTYRELNERSNQLSHYLKDRGAEPEELIPICIERGSWMIVSILGVLKSGAAYVPLDPDYPEERISFMLGDVSARLLVSSEKSRKSLGDIQRLKLIEVDGADASSIRAQALTNPKNSVSADQLAYVIYTSGSTGRPKGVLVEHGSVVNLIRAQTLYFSINSGDRILQFSNYCFDASVEQIFLALSNGASLVAFREDLLYNTALFEAYLRTQKVSHLHATPFFLENITPDNYPHLRRVIAGGDVCRKELAARWKGKVDFYNEYGPTETTVTSIEYHDVGSSQERSLVPIGKPLVNVSLYILDQHGALCPEGIPGELYIGGVQVARGYLNRPELTTERFIANPFGFEEKDRLYRTGDLARWLSDGNIEYLGRIDDQVKVRGYRIELGEIESVLNELEPVENSCVVVKHDINTGSRLTAYYIPKMGVVKKKEHALYNEQIESWKEIHENEYVLAEEEESADPEFDILGWNNSFTRQPIAAEQMREWLEDITAVIMAQTPEQVLEVGCGSGLIYYQLAGKIKRYRGTDFSRHSINKIRERILHGGRNYGPTELEVCAAHEISIKEDEQPDTIIINSVVQYFPGEDYLSSVIEKSISLLKGKGRIIIGDVRDNRTLEIFKSRLQLAKQHNVLDIDEFKWSVKQEVLREEELCFSPEYFYNLPHLYQQITHVDIQWKQGIYINELSQYRFTAIIHVGLEKDILTPKWQDWDSTEKQNLLFELKEGRSVIAVKDAPNHRLWQERSLADALEGKSAKTTADLVEAMKSEDKGAAEVENLLNTAIAAGYHYRLFLDEDPFKINILLEKEHSDSFVQSVYSTNTNWSNGMFTNIPLFSDISLLLQKELRSLLRERLPDYMIPSEFTALNHLPLNSNGKIDRKFLGHIDNRIAADKLSYQAPRNETEQTLAEIWEELLSVERVGVHDNFFEIGGHSLLGMRVISSIRKELEVELVIKDLFIHPTIAELADFLNSQNTGLLYPRIEVQPRPVFIPLSYSQERLWFIDQLEGSTRYHLPSVLRLDGALKIDELERALRTSVSRHEVLRTVLLENSGIGYQYVLDHKDWKLDIADGSIYHEDERALNKYITELIKKPFDLSKDYMFRATLICLSDNEHILVVTMHHIASDAWSVSVIVDEVVELYSSIIEKRSFKLPKLPIQYADYSIWQRQYLSGETLNKKVNYWKNKLDGVLPLQLPSDYSRPSAWSGRGAMSVFQLDKTLSEALLLLCRKQGTTLFMMLEAAFKVLLHRYSGQADICIGTSVANRTQKELEGLIGFFVNMVALRSSVSSDIPFTEFLQQIKANTLEAFAEQDVPFEKVVDAVITERDVSRNPLIQVMLILLNTPEVPEMRLGDVVLSRVNQQQTTTLFDLSFYVTESPEGLQGTVHYATDLYTEHTIERMIGHFKELLDSIISAPELKVGNLNILTPEEKNVIQLEFNRNQTDCPRDQSITQLFEQQALKNPESIAVKFEGEQLSYRELNNLSNQLAYKLISRGVRKGMMVPICVERGLEMITGILGILKAGGAYVPIDLEYPKDRISYMLEDTSATVVLSTKGNRKVLEDLGKEIDIVDIELFAPSSLHASELPVVGADDLAYVIYTSGSTGRPKGVLVEHGNVVSLVKGIDYIHVGAEDTLLSTGSPSFDASTFEYWAMLLNGGRLLLCSESRLLNSESLKNEIIRNNVNKMWFTSSWFNQLVETDITVFQTLDSILVGGEKLSEKHISQVRETYPGVRLINGYGPTENTTFSLTYEINDLSALNTIPVGKPLNNRKVYIVDDQFQLSPIGVPGEIYLGGAGLSRGYLNQPELTAEKFVTDPFDFERGSRLYKTGDSGRWLPDGNIEFLGRIDDQVKIRGYRIEPGEIEKVLEKCERVRQAVVLVKADDSGHKRLVAYVTSEGTFDKEFIRDYALSILPEYMVPALWVELEMMPLTSNGKINKRALPDPDMNEMHSEDFAAPRNDFEIALAEIWEDLLGIDRVGIYDNFFELGGDSILTIQVVSRMRRLGYEFQVNDIFTHQTIDKLSSIIDAAPGNDQSVEQGLLEGDCGLLPVQQWFFEMELTDISHFNQGVLLKIDKAVASDVLSQAVNQLINQHDALRFKYSQNEGEWQQQYQAKEAKLIAVDLKSVSEDSLADLISNHADKYQRSLDIEKGGLMQVVLMETPPGERYNRLFIVIHHLAIDGVSWRILLDDLEVLLSGAIANESPKLGAKTSSYRDWYKALEAYSQTRNLIEQTAYWKQIVSAYEPFPSDYSYTDSIRVKEIVHHSIQLDAAQTLRLLQEVPRVYHTEINDILLGALAQTLCTQTEKNSVIIGLEGHGRENISKGIDTSRTIGWFTSLYPILLEAKETYSADELIKAVKEQLRRIPDKGLGYGVLKYINKESALQGDEPWDIMFNYLGQLDNAISESKWLKGAEESAGAGRSVEQIVKERLSVDCYIRSGVLVVRFNYSNKHFKEETISGLASDYIAKLEWLITHCVEMGKTGVVYTPSDYGVGSEISYEELDKFLGDDDDDNIMSF
ncbi:non-ribosomal peptide synthase/polyketide synthase [Pedobacter sp. P351]|uniref:non-ribosomal peptide synthase/polyketide synthase n=1 Tax=Pedobacter superstes TaxID=3133441 RepID=UPI00309F8F13